MVGESCEFALSPILNSGFGAVKSSVVTSLFLMKLVVFLNGLPVHVIDVWWVLGYCFE